VIGTIFNFAYSTDALDTSGLPFICVALGFASSLGAGDGMEKE
jgi:hypothetical protein